jgi:chromosome segregation ATPase
MRKQLDAKWRQLDHFEASVRKVELVKTQWRNKLAQKQGELDSLQAKHADLAAQLSGVKGMTRSESTADAKASTTRIATLERRLNNALNQMSTYEEKLASARAKMAAAESRWDVRVREYESRLKAAEEKVKAEKQGGKERAAQLDMQVECVSRLSFAGRRRSRALTAPHHLPDCAPTPETSRSKSRWPSGGQRSCRVSSRRRPVQAPAPLRDPGLHSQPPLPF